MNEKQINIKKSSKAIAALMKIGYIAMIVAVSISVCNLAFLVCTGGDMEVYTSSGITIKAAIVDENINTTEGIVALSIAVIIMSAFMFVIFLFAYQIFNEISKNAMPFNEKYVKRIKQIGILIAVMTLVGNTVDAAASAKIGVSTLGICTDSTGIAFGIIIYCLAFIFDYGCMLQKQSDETL